MILDERNEFADANTAGVQGATGTELLGDVIDLGLAGRDIGNGEPLYLVIQVTTEIDSAMDGASVNFQLASDGQAAIDTGGGATVHAETGAIAEASLVEGAQFVVPVPSEGNTYEEFLGVLVVRSGEAVTAGAVNAFLTRDVAKWKAYDSPSQA